MLCHRRCQNLTKKKILNIIVSLFTQNYCELIMSFERIIIQTDLLRSKGLQTFLSFPSPVPQCWQPPPSLMLRGSMAAVLCRPQSPGQSPPPAPHSSPHLLQLGSVAHREDVPPYRGSGPDGSGAGAVPPSLPQPGSPTRCGMR